MTHGVNATVNSMQPPGANPFAHGIVTQPSISKLMDRDDAMLSRGNTSHPGVWPVTLFGYTPNKLTALPILPPRLRKGGYFSGSEAANSRYSQP